MHVQIETFTVRKRFALTISRGTTAQSTNLWVKLEHEGIEGWGEVRRFPQVLGPKLPKFC